MFTLTYAMRIVCVASIGMGATHLFLYLTLQSCLPGLCRAVGRQGARAQERFFFALMMCPPLVAILATALLVVPGFISRETNHRPEDTGLFCILAFTAVWAWYGTGFARSARMLVETCLFEKSLKHHADKVEIPGDEASAWIIAGDKPLLALVGVFRPRIVLSRRLVDASALHPAALRIALKHERAHASRGDNWKLLLANLLPGLPLCVSHSLSAREMWKRHAEWAADDEAIDGDPDRALLLAESLLFFARSSAASLNGILATGLAGPDSELAMRIQRLLMEHPPIASGAKQGRHSLLAMSALCFSLAVAIGTFFAYPFLHAVAEYLLHLG
jgi:BlaR1 peptidase M56